MQRILYPAVFPFLGPQNLIDFHPVLLGNQGGLEIRWAPVGHVIFAFNSAGFKPGTFFQQLTYNAGPVAANVGFTYRF